MEERVYEYDPWIVCHDRYSPERLVIVYAAAVVAVTEATSGEEAQAVIHTGDTGATRSFTVKESATEVLALLRATRV